MNKTFTLEEIATAIGIIAVAKDVLVSEWEHEPQVLSLIYKCAAISKVSQEGRYTDVYVEPITVVRGR